MSIQSKYKDALAAKAAGFFSRRHQTSEAHFNEKMKRDEKEKMAKVDREARTEFWQSLSPQEQLGILDRKLGKDLGAAKQRAKINAKLTGTKGT
jgi:hypothetical protein